LLYIFFYCWKWDWSKWILERTFWINPNRCSFLFCFCNEFCLD